MATQITGILSRLPIPFIFSATGFLASEATVLMSMIPSTFDGLSTVYIISGLAFVAGSFKWIHSELGQLYPTLNASPVTNVVSSVPVGSGLSKVLVPVTFTNTPKAAPVSSSPSIITNYDKSKATLSVSGSNFTKGSTVIVNMGAPGLGYSNIGKAQVDQIGSFYVDCSTFEISLFQQQASVAQISTVNVLATDSSGVKVQQPLTL